MGVPIMMAFGFGGWSVARAFICAVNGCVTV